VLHGSSEWSTGATGDTLPAVFLYTGVIWTGFLSRFRVDDRVSFELCGVDWTVLEKQKS